MTFPGLGGQQPPPQNSAPAGQLTPGIQPGASGQVVASRVIIIGTGGELLVYSPTAGAGNLILSIAGNAGTDPFGNAFPAGLTVGAASGPQVEINTTAGHGQVTITPGSTSFVGGVLEGATSATTPAYASMAILGPASTNASHDDYMEETFNSANSSGTSSANIGWFYVNTSGAPVELGTLDSTDWTMSVNLHVSGALFGTGGVLTIGDNVDIVGTLSVNGSTSTGGPDSTLSGLTTSGASAGTAHTHTLPFFLPTATHGHPL